MMIHRDTIIEFCRRYLQVDKFQDDCLNGLQVEGSPKVEKIVTGVSLSQKLIAAAVKRKAQMIIVHHGIFSEALGRPPAIKGVLKERLRLLLEHGINLAAFHLPLDAHPQIGNNISLCRLLGVTRPRPLDVGFMGRLPKPLTFQSWLDLVNKRLGVKAFSIPAGPKHIKCVAVISGGASPEFEKAKQAGADTFLCGDVREHIVRAVEEAGINFINAGHYNTEKLGVQNLGKLLAKKFNLAVEFVEIPCDV